MAALDKVERVVASYDAVELVEAAHDAVGHVLAAVGYVHADLEVCIM